MTSGKGWSTIDLAGHPCDIFEPGSRHPHGYVLVYLHGVHQNRLVENTAYSDQFERLGLPVAAPHTRRSWWTDRICLEFDPQRTAEQYLLEHVLPFLRERWNADVPRVGLWGTSMGGQGALRLAYKHPAVFPVVAAISPAIDYHHRFDEDETLPQMYSDPEQVRQDTAILHLHPLNWPRHQFFCCDPTDLDWWDSADRLRMKLASLGVPHTCDLETSGGGHGFEFYNQMAERTIDFLVHSLDSERRRLH